MKNSEQSAFGYGYANEQSHQEVTGLTKREYFAGLAMQGLLANSSIIDLLKQADVGEQEDRRVMAVGAIKMADELLKQLDNGNL